ncbi:DUF1080 domain-containing protein [Halobacteria archaeon AArc-dxtr1]|nr:DUF1080 domain-containing protein [Halobacteria archaeon AArc-dxtr1]
MGAAGLAGCLGSGDDDENGDDANGDDDGDDTENGEENGHSPPPEELWPERVDPGAEGLWSEPPSDATVLWDGETATLDDWEHSGWSPSATEPDGAEPLWIEEDDYFEVVPDTGDLRPKMDELGAGMGDCHVHVEWMQPAEEDDEGNSGVFMMERYEIQIIDDSGWMPEQLAGTYYTDAAPHVLPLRPEGEWNDFDIFWRVPHFENGEVVRYPQLTVFFNGVPTKVHYDVPGTNWGGVNDFDDPDLGHPTDENGDFVMEWPFFLQEHGDIVRFRNVWYRDLPERPVEDHEHPDSILEYESADGGSEEPERIDAGGLGTAGEPPEDAEVLIDAPISIEPGDGDWVSDDEYGDSQIHLEWRVPDSVEAVGLERGNSGIQIGDYKIQILDNYDNATEADEWAGAYPPEEPYHDAVRESGEWQQFDILWQSAQFADGELDKPARVTAILNGVVVQARLELDGPNADGTIGDYEEHSAELPLRLLEADSRIQFQNTWVRSLG